jgi:hypothetical protein
MKLHLGDMKHAFWQSGKSVRWGWNITFFVGVGRRNLLA